MIDHIKSELSQVASELGVREAWAVGTSVLALAGFGPATAGAAVTDPFAAGSGETPLVDPVATAATSAAQCEALALERPGHLTGNYETFKVPNDNLYDISFSLTSLRNCQGTRKVKALEQQLTLGYGLHPKLEWQTIGETKTFPDTNGMKNVHATVRAVHACWPRPVDPWGNSDKTGHVKGRPAVVETWTPTGGAPVKVTFSGTPRQVCK